ncbi:MAG: response regulator [Pseudomonadota bacterium]
MKNNNRLQDLCVLYLEDEALIAFDTSQLLEEMGFGEVSCAYRLCDAEAAAAKQHFDLAIFDINVDGGQTSVALGEDLAAKGTKVIFASGSTKQAAKMAKKGYPNLGKPFSSELLEHAIAAALRGHAEFLNDG